MVHLGEKYNKWTVIDCDNSKKYLSFICKCECGRVVSVAVSNLVYNKSTRCSVCAREVRRETRLANARKIFPGYVSQKLIPCVDCGKQNGFSLRCKSCSAKHRIGYSYKYPATLQSVATRVGTSRQAVQQLVGRYGWEGMLKFHGLPIDFKSEAGSSEENNP